MAMALRGRTQLKVLLVSLTRDVSEITALVRSAGHELSDTVVQLRDAPDRRYFVGKGGTGFGVRLLVEIARRLTR